MSFHKIKNEARLKYQGFKSIHSPALDCEVNFNAKGFNHISFRKNQDFRSLNEQIERFAILEIAYELVLFSNTYQEHESIEETEYSKKVEYWGLIAIFKSIKLKVILRKVGNGDVHFWSVIPGYTTSEKRDGKFKMKGNPEQD